MASRQSRPTVQKPPARGTEASRTKVQKKQTDAAGISNRPPTEEKQRQEKLPPRGQAKR